MPAKQTGAGDPTAKAEALKIRPLEPGDLDAIVAIDRAVAGKSRRGFYAKRLAALERDPDAFVALSADLDGRLVGFAFARFYEGEFGGAAPEASLDAIAVDPAARRRGVARELLDGMTAAMRKHGVKELSTQVDWGVVDLMGFFARAEFSPAPRIVLERAVGDLPRK